MIRQRLLKDQVLSDRERKNIAILELIGKSGPMTKTDISKITELNIVTVSNYINNYIKAGLIEEKGFDVSTGGRKPTLVDLNYKSGYVLGVGLSAFFDEISAVLVDYGSNVIQKKTVSWDPADKSERLIEQMAVCVEELIEESGIESDKLKGIGVGLPGIIDDRGATVKWNSRVGDMIISVCLPVRSVFEKRFRVPVFIERNDAAAVAGERWLGLGSDIQNILFVYLGIGCGMMICGQLYRGTSGTAGELGIQAESGSALGGLDVLDINVSLKQLVQDQIASGQASRLKDSASLSFHDIVSAAQENDPVALYALQKSGVDLGRKVSFLVNLLNPEVVVIGGGLELAGPVFLDVIRKTVKTTAVEEAANVVKIIPSSMGEHMVAKGAASVVIQELFAQV